MATFKTSVIISTYNQPEWLEKVLWSYEFQSFKNFEVIIADDGSTDETKQLIEHLRKEVSYPIQHVWHRDNGFQKTKILNKAVVKSTSEYLIFTDGDCIARKDFVETHLRLSQPNYFLSGGYFKLPKSISDIISKEDIKNQDCFNIEWLVKNGLKKTFKSNKLTSARIKVWFLNKFTTTKATFDGMNVSAWKNDILKVNGFDEHMQYGGEDREIGERLFNISVKAKQIRYSAICLHLEHERSYINPQMIKVNNEIRKQTKKNKSIYTDFGIISKNTN
jgi:glycosyltransferase involved in cell wall biosynthesis